MKEDPVGAPVRFLYMPSSGGKPGFHHTSHLAAFENKSGERVESLHLIVEFGGGGIRKLLPNKLHCLGFRGNYVIFDLPELSGLRRDYLGSLGFPILARDAWIDPTAEGIVLLTDTKDLSAVVGDLRCNFSPSLFVATWSLSEDTVVHCARKYWRWLASSIIF